MTITSIPQFKYLSFTAVIYDPSDIISYCFAWFSLVPQALVIVEFTAFIFAETTKRRIQVGSLLIGQVANEIFNNLLKKTIREPRPEITGRSDFGMPSSHAQFISFLLMAVIILFPVRNLQPQFQKRLNMLIRAFAFMATFLVSTSRIYLGYHDSRQVMAGVIVGLIFGWVWSRFYKIQVIPLITKDSNLQKGKIE